MSKGLRHEIVLTSHMLVKQQHGGCMFLDANNYDDEMALVSKLTLAAGLHQVVTRKQPSEFTILYGVKPCSTIIAPAPVMLLERDH